MPYHVNAIRMHKKMLDKLFEKKIHSFISQSIGSASTPPYNMTFLPLYRFEMSPSICCCRCFVLAINFAMIGLIFSFSAPSVTIFSLRISRVERVLSTVINCCCNLAAKIFAYLKDNNNKNNYLSFVGGNFS